MILSTTLRVTCKKDKRENIEEIKMGVGYNHTAIIKADNSLWMGGQNNKGQSGDSTNTSRNIPVKKVDNVRVFQQVRSIALSLQPRINCEQPGNNLYGQLGDGSFQNRNFYVAVYWP